MSTRQLRKLQKQRELEKFQESEGQNSNDSDEEEDVSLAPATKARPNLFATLGGEDEDGNEDGQEDDNDDDNAGGVAIKQEAEPEPEPSSKKSKKKKKKKKAKAAAAASTPAEDEAGEDDDEIDKAMRELNIAPRDGSGVYSSAADEKLRRQAATNNLLQINPYHLKAIHEMRNLFGREVIESADAEEENQQQQQHGRRGRRRQIPRQVDLETYLRELPGAKKLPEVSLRRNIFIQGKDYWPAQSAGGLTMKEVAKEEGAWTEYTYVHDGEYDSMQVFFFACVQMGDPMRMVHLLKRVPYHVSTLLQVSFVAKQDQNMALSAELCERALFAFGRVTTSAFRQNVEQGKARLDFRRPENRQFWLAGYHYLRSLLRKGTFRTALEWAKLLYALDPKDPYAMRHYIHFLGIRAYESKWLLEFLADMEQDSEKHPDFVYIQQSRVLARLQTGDVETAKKELAEGIQTVPWLYCALFQELGLDAPPSIWGINAESDSRAFWVKLYTYLTKDLWNNTQAISLLQQVAKGMDKVDTSLLPVDDAAPDLSAARLAYLEGQTSLIGLAPRELLDRQPNYEFDPMPPAEEDNIFTHEGTQLPWKDSHGESSEALMRMRNALAMQHAAGGPGAGAGADMMGAAGAAGGVGAIPQGFAAQQGFGDDSDGDYASDDELRRDLEEHARRANEPGLLGNLMNLLGVGGRRGQEQQEGEEGDEGNFEEFVEEEDGDDVPGAWPENGRG